MGQHRPLIDTVKPDWTPRIVHGANPSMEIKMTDIKTYALTVPFNKDKGATSRTIEVSEVMLIALATHGAKQKANDSYAQLSADKSADSELLKEFDATLKDLVEGKWTVREGLSTIEKLIRTTAEKSYKPANQNGVKWGKLEAEGKKTEYNRVRANAEAMAMLSAMALARDEEEALLQAII